MHNIIVTNKFVFIIITMVRRVQLMVSQVDPHSSNLIVFCWECQVGLEPEFKKMSGLQRICGIWVKVKCRKRFKNKQNTVNLF